jgi:heterodisulfide reductase subunit A
VLTQSDLALALTDGPLRAREIVVVQCVGSRTPERPYCSRACCAEAMANVLRIKEQDPGAEVTVLHRGIRVWGFDEELFADAVDLGVRFVRVEEPPTISAGDALEISAVDADEGESLSLTPDLVVLSTGVLPSTANGELARAFGVEVDGDGFLVPIDEALRPVETARTGVFVCGTACWPAGVREAVTQARAAAGKACLFLMGGGDDDR